MKHSKQRELIRQTVQHSPEHLTADQVYEQLKTEHATLSLGTVYRNLNLLAEQGVIRRIPVSGGADRFDKRVEEHHHMMCQQCGKMYDCTLPQLEDIDAYLRNLTGFSVAKHDFLVFGLCKDCQTK